MCHKSQGWGSDGGVTVLGKQKKTTPNEKLMTGKNEASGISKISQLRALWVRRV